MLAAAADLFLHVGLLESGSSHPAKPDSSAYSITLGSRPHQLGWAAAPVEHSAVLPGRSVVAAAAVAAAASLFGIVAVDVESYSGAFLHLTFPLASAGAVDLGSEMLASDAEDDEILAEQAAEAYSSVLVLAYYSG